MAIQATTRSDFKAFFLENDNEANDASVNGDAQKARAYKDNHKKNMFITLMAIGILAVVALGGIGIASLVQAHGIHMPQCFEWISPISQTHNAWGAWTMAACGTVLGTSAIAVGARKYHILKNALENDAVTNQLDLKDSDWQELYDLIKGDLNYNPQRKIEQLNSPEYDNKVIYRIHYENDEVDDNYDEYAYIIKTPSMLIPAPSISVDDPEKHNKLTTLLGRLGYTLQDATDDE